MTKYPMWLLIGAVVVGLIAAVFVVVPFAPVSEGQGTAPSALVAPSESKDTDVAPRDAAASSNPGRAARGSGVEGVTSGGTTQASPAGR